MAENIPKLTPSQNSLPYSRYYSPVVNLAHKQTEQKKRTGLMEEMA